MHKKIWLSSPHMGGEELNYIHEAFEANWIAPLGPNVNGFEEDLQNYLNIPHAAALSSGTGAIHLALILLGVTQGDEVLVSTFTFSATVNPICYQGAIPVFIDSERDTWNMDPVLLEEAIKDRISKGKKPKAIMVVHLYGMPAKIDDIMAIARKYQIPVIEDAAEALGSEYKGQKLGTFGDFGILSFNGNKIITTSGGGALVSRDENAIAKARFLATQARDDAPHYQHTHIGYNYRMSNICAGIGRGQMKVIDKRVKQRRNNRFYYEDQFKDIPEIQFLSEPSKDFFSNYWLTTITVGKSAKVNREDIRNHLLDYTIESRPLWKPMHMQPIFETYPVYLSGVAEELFDIGLCLPSGSDLTTDNLDFISSNIKNIL